MNVLSSDPFYETDPVFYLCPECSRPVSVATLQGNEAVCRRCATVFRIAATEETDVTTGELASVPS